MLNNPKMYKFSVIIPTYNRAVLLKRCLESLCTQTYKNFEVIVCDDGSTDDTSEIVSQFNDRLNLKYLIDRNWGGPARPRNNGIKTSSGEWICFLDSDDWWRMDKLEKCLPYLSENDLIYHDLVMLNEATINSVESAFVYKARRLEGDILRDLLINGNPIANSSVVIRKKIVDKIGEITEDRDLIAIEDFDYWVRATFHTNRFLYIKESLGYYWIENNISQGLTQIKKELYFYKKYSSFLSLKDKITANKVLNYRIARLYHINAEYQSALKYYLNAITLKARFKYFLNPILGSFLSVMHVKK